MVRHLLQAPLEPRDLAADGAAVGFELGLARAPEADATADTGQVGPHAGEAGGGGFELGELPPHLCLAPAGSGGQSFEDDPGAIHHPAREALFENMSLDRP